MVIYVDSAYQIPLPTAPGQAYSEFNHHLAGLVVLLVGLSAILVQARPRPFGFLKYVWPLSFIFLGLYLIVYSDPDAWPTSRVSLLSSLHDPETLQHKIFALLLIAMGAVELARTAGWARNERWRLAFPALAVVGALYLILHKHGSGHGGMSGGMEMQGMPMHGDPMSMTLINYQHAGYIIMGVLIAASRILYDTRRLTGPAAAYVWPALTSILGLMLMFYRE
jgi:putative copper resistance protein D